eukprot:6819674-Prymnesium_polylepis.2
MNADGGSTTYACDNAQRPCGRRRAHPITAPFASLVLNLTASIVATAIGGRAIDAKAGCGCGCDQTVARAVGTIAETSQRAAYDEVRPRSPATAALRMCTINARWLGAADAT